ncbi:MAG: 23S rRNA (adenine(2030)-N(6))-methyltransferase RlmJ [Burkholderiales bacterium]|nr:23S rRNA (adenine(2030)-N(6))-methyltransferase RlmJ [Burkholderiales bacterium]
MLAYRHLFHAGNFADVFKHALLVRLLAALGQKAKPFFYLDTHAGLGRYDLAHAWAQKAREFDHGIARVWLRRDAPPALAGYLAAMRAENPDGRLRYYPGSPCIARHLLRPGDRMALTELNKSDCAELAARFAGDRQVQVRRMDGYEALGTFLPPKERRGLVLLDSSFDRAGEFARIAAAIAGAHRRWATGTYAVWYPAIERPAIRRFEREIADTGIRKVLQLELCVVAETATRALQTGVMLGCGMLVINPPWRLDEEAAPLLDWLAQAMARDGKGARVVRWLVPE